MNDFEDIFFYQAGDGPDIELICRSHGITDCADCKQAEREYADSWAEVAA